MYAVMRFNKLKTMGQVSSRGAHNERTRDTPNADGARLRRRVAQQTALTTGCAR